MQKAFDARHLDVESFAAAQGSLEGTQPLGAFERLMQESRGLGGERPVRWRATGSVRSGAGALAAAALALQVEASVPLVCQRCLEPVDVALAVERSFRFAQDEATAAALDEDSDDDMLVTSRDFDLLALVEDELLLAAPLVPTHALCPVPVQLAVADPDFDAALDEKPNPFAALVGFKTTPRQ